MKPHLLHVFSTFAPGGPQVRTVQLIAALGNEWRHSILAMDARQEARELLPGDADVTLLASAPKSGTAASVRRLLGVLGETRPDLLLTYNWGAIEALMAARLARLGSVLHHEDGFLPDELQSFKRRRIWTRRLVLRGAAAVIVPSRNLERIARESWRLPEGLVHYIPNGIRPQTFAGREGRDERRRELGIGPDDVLIGSCGHLRGEKNPVRLVRAFAGMRAKAHVLLLGDGDERAAVERARAEGGRPECIHLLGHCEEPAPYYACMDVFALSSDTEQMPVALLEAMAAGLAVASTDVGDVRAMLPLEQADWIVPLTGDDPTGALGRALDELVGDPELRRRLGQVNRARVHEQYSFESMLEAYRERYRAALAR